jgi:hypothetical protein
MHWTLYIDESGDFEDSGRDWIIAGVLVNLPKADADGAFDHACLDMCRHFGLFGRREFHLTELKAKGIDRAVAVAETLMETTATAFREQGYSLHIVAVRNRLRRLSEKKKTYRAMLFDLLALADTVAGNAPSKSVGKIDLVIASRSTDGPREEQLASLVEETREALYQALEADLVTRGLVDLVGDDRLSIQVCPVHEHWGTVTADFAANLIYNRRFPESGSLVDRWEREGHLRVFASLGGYAERRARVAERDGDLPTALFRWSLLPRNTSGRMQEMTRLWERILRETGTSGPGYGLGIILERLHRTPDFSDAERMACLSELEVALLAVDKAGELSSWLPPLRIRLANYRLLCANRAGDSRVARQVWSDLQPLLESMAPDPDVFTDVLNAYARSVEAALNELDAQEALRRAERYEQIVDTWRSVWELLHADVHLSEVDAGRHFDSSREAVRARAVVLRAKLHTLAPESREIKGLVEELERAEHSVTRESDRTRLRCYRVAALLRAGQPDVALQFALQGYVVPPRDAFLRFWTARSINDWRLASSAGLPSTEGYSAHELLLPSEKEYFTDVTEPQDYVQALHLREHGLHMVLQSESRTPKSVQERASTYVEASRDFFDRDKDLSPFNARLAIIGEEHRQFVAAKKCSRLGMGLSLLKLRRSSPE